MSGVQILTIGPDESDQRFDRWLRRQFPYLTQGTIERMCRKGELRIDGSRAKPSSRIQEGQLVRIPPQKQFTHELTESVRKSNNSERDAEMMRSCVVYRDDDIIVLNKPSGLASQGGSGQGERHVDGLTDALTFGYKNRPKLVHRLDKETSGILMLARSDRVARLLSQALHRHLIKKVYWAIVAGAPHPKRATIRYGLVKSGGRGEEKIRCVHPQQVDKIEGAKHAVTHYALLASLGSRLSWVALAPVTGRTHQLRAHMAEIGHPIVGDGRYGLLRQHNPGDGWGSSVGADFENRLHLHARSITFEHPISHESLTVTAKLPPHMQQTFDYIGWTENDIFDEPFEGSAQDVKFAKRGISVRQPAQNDH